MRRHALTRVAAPFLFTGLFLALAWRTVRPDAASLKQAMAAMHPGWIALNVVIMVAAMVVRTLRWSELLRPMERVPLRRLVPVSFVGYMAIFTLPAVGELVRPVLLRAVSSVRGGAALATVAIERALDGLVVALAAFLALAPLRGLAGTPRWVDLICFGTLAGFSGVLALLALLRWKRERVLVVLERVLTPASPRIAARVTHGLRPFLDGLGLLTGARTVLATIGFTLVYWWLNGLAVQVAARAFGLELTQQMVWSVIGVVVLGYLIPAVAQVGTYHYLFTLGLGLYLTKTALAGPGAAFAVVSHAVQVTVFVTGGVVALFSPEVKLLRRAAAHGTLSLQLEEESP